MILIKQMYIFPDSSEMEKHVAIVYLAEKKKKKSAKSATLEHRGYIRKASKFFISLIYNLAARERFWRLVADLN